MFDDVQSMLRIIVVSTVAILAILNPFGNLPQFLNMTDGFPPNAKQKLFRNIVLTALIIVVLFLFGGPIVMEYLFRVKMADLRVAGGLILIVMGIKNLLFPLSTKYSLNKDETVDDLIRKSIIPMAFPMLVGPGTLATVIVMSTDNGAVVALISVLIAFLFIFILFHFSASIERVVGKLVLHVIARVMQVFIVAIGIKMLTAGMMEIVPMFNK